MDEREYTYEELYNEYTEFVEEDVADKIEDDEILIDVECKDEFDENFEEAWEDAEESEFTFEEWLDMYGYEKLENGNYRLAR